MTNAVKNRRHCNKLAIVMMKQQYSIVDPTSTAHDSNASLAGKLHQHIRPHSVHRDRYPH